jgi:ParB family chromosome partitioning protein
MSRPEIYRRIPLSQIIVNTGQARKSFPQAEIQQLAESLKARGQLNPLIVRFDVGRDLYILSSGERRFRAMQLLGWEEADCKVLDREPDETDMLRESIEENIHRADLRPMEIARAIERLQAIEGGTLAAIADSLHISPATATRLTALLLLPADVQAMVDDGRVNARVAYAISRLCDESQQRELAELAAAGKLTCTQAEEEVQKRIGKRESKPREDRIVVKRGKVAVTVCGADAEEMAKALAWLARMVRKGADEGKSAKEIAEGLRNGE